MTVATKIEREFHICYIKGKNLCTGVNIKASDYDEAASKFREEFGEKEVLYISIKN